MKKREIQPLGNQMQQRQAMAKNVLPKVRKLVNEFDLPAVNRAVKMLYEERQAERELKEAEKKAEELRKKLGNK